MDASKNPRSRSREQHTHESHSRRSGDQKHEVNRSHGQCQECQSFDLMRQERKKKKTLYVCANCGHKMYHPVMTDKTLRHDLPRARRYLITVAQNATPIHKQFWKALMHAKDYYDAELVVLRTRYRNPTSIWSQKSAASEWWDNACVPYLFAGRKSLNNRIDIIGDIMIQCASGNPLSELDALTHERSGIVGHPRRALRSVAVPSHKHPKLMMTTGACTIPNYVDAKRGALGEFNHTIGAIIVELDARDVYYVRQLNASTDGSFIDLDCLFTPKGVYEAPPAISLTMGDTHQRWIASDVERATFDDKRSMVNILRPENLVWHDLFDQYARNHHHREDWITGFAKWKYGLGDLKQEATSAIHFVNEKTPADCTSHIVSSNHDRALERWVREIDFRTDPENIEFYLETALKCVKSIRITTGGVVYDDPFVALGRTLANPNVHMLTQGESLVLADVEHGLHGDQGPNGSRGTTRNLSRLGVKVTKGHDHTAGIEGGCYSVGKSTDPMVYERGGPSSHTKAHCVLYANGKRSILFIVNGKWCLPRP